MGGLIAALFVVAFVGVVRGLAGTSGWVRTSSPERPQLGEEGLNRVPLKLPLVKAKIVVEKGERRLTLYSGGEAVRVYRVGLGFNPVGDKVKEGDGATPEGEFYVFTKNEKSAFYLSLGVSYPNVEDAERGLRDGLIGKDVYEKIVDASRRRVAPPQDTPLGGQIYIHGHGAHADWTRGCVALDDKDIKELFDAVMVGTRVVIKP